MSENDNIINEQTVKMPLLALRGMGVFPGMLLTFDVERRASVMALNMAVRADQLIFLAAQKDLTVDVPEEHDIYSVGTVCRVRQQIHQPHGNITRVLVEGLYRAQAVSMNTGSKGHTAEVIRLYDKQERVSETRREALIRNCLTLFEEYIQMNPEMVNEQLLNVLANPNASYVSDYIAQNVRLSLEDKQKLLEELSPCRRLTMLGKQLNRELDILSLERELNDSTQQAVNRAQREFYLREQLKVIQNELGGEEAHEYGSPFYPGNNLPDEFQAYVKSIKSMNASKEVKEKLLKDVDRLSKQPYGSAEASLLRGYLDVCKDVPWNVKTKDCVDIERAKKVLDSEHYGLDKVKERIIEYLAVKQLSPDVKGGLICLVGPPGTGKTSIAMSVARATKRKLCRVSLGGVHDEAEIRGHRKTYIGAMPGRIVNGIIQCGSLNPVMVLDEIDKLGSEYHGDPSAALLEVLDSEQNSSFRDNYLEVPLDLSDVFFITTANSVDTIPRPLLDRMEIIEMPSYTDEEKLRIAQLHLLPKERKKHGLKTAQLKINDGAMRELISNYTRESGVRQLEREIAAVCRKTAAGIAEGKYTKLSVTADMLPELIGPAKFKPEPMRLYDEVGLVHGLAYTAVGGEMLDVEALVTEGSGRFELTGNLGDVMKESAKAAVSFIRSRAVKLGVDDEFYKNRDIHIHYPEGAIPKDGPSAGITTCVAVVSALTGRPVRHDIAMTGEITLRGRVLPIGGLREKTMAALRNGVKNVIIPAGNEPDLDEIDQNVRKELNFIPVNYADEAIDAALIPEKTEFDRAPRAPHRAAAEKPQTLVRQ